MRIHLGAVGRMKAGPEKELERLYFERAAALGRTAGITALNIREITESRATSPELRKSEEAAKLLSGAPAGAVMVALDVQGRDLSSEELAAALGRWRDSGTAEVAFLIGGPDGHGPELLAQASATFSFGRMTWPHRLVRVMLLEQIYRAVTILVNHPYHRM
jgi:23S rRNA (pseudouridine1915-N3)-methyltransferase